jgi:hypothetical protein
MSGMEPDIRNFLSKVMSSLSVGLLWLLINTTVGIGFGYAFFEKRPTAGNYIFYLWFLVSLFLLIRYYRKKWKF